MGYVTAMRREKELNLWLKDKQYGDFYALQSVLDSIRGCEDVSAKVDFPASASEIQSFSLQLVQLLREGYTDLRIFEELSTLPLAYSTAAPDVERIVSDKNLSTHYTRDLFFIPKDICLSSFIVEDYVTADASPSEEVIAGGRDYLTFVLSRCECDDELMYTLYWRIRSAAISLHAKSIGRLDSKTDGRCVDSCLYYVVQALIVLTGRFLMPPVRNLSSPGNKNAKSDHQNLHISSSHLYQSEDAESVLDSISELFAPISSVIAAHDDLTALYAVLCNSLNSGSDENITMDTVNASTVSCMEHDDSYSHPELSVDQEHVQQVYAHGQDLQSYPHKLTDLPEFDGSDLSNSIGDDWSAVEGCDTWRTVVPASSLLTASTIMLLCHPPQNILITKERYQEVERTYLSNIAYGRSCLTTIEQSALDKMVTTTMKMDMKGFTVHPGPGSSSSSAACKYGSNLLQIKKQCKLFDAIRAAILRVTEGSSISESHSRKNERFQDALRSHIGPGTFGSCATVCEGCDAEQNGDITKGAHLSDPAISSGAVVSNSNSTHTSKDKEIVSDVNKHNTPPVDHTSASASASAKESIYPILSPLHPHDVLIVGLDISKCRMLRSSKHPALLVFSAKKIARGLSGSDPATSTSTSTSTSSVAYTVLLKQEDDVRQDELAMQIVRYMDRILKGAALDLELLTYEVLALGPREGIIEWVTGAEPLSAIIDNHGTRVGVGAGATGASTSSGTGAGTGTGTQSDSEKSSGKMFKRSSNPIRAFLQHHSPCDKCDLGVREEVMKTFMKSCAGYCVITYILGVGDRHMDNIMLTPDGHFFHVDYGFLFGRDPKPFRPLVRFTQEMVAALGGANHPLLLEFLSVSCRAFNILRKSSAALISLVYLMRGAGIADLGDTQGPQEAISGILDRLQPHLDDEAASALMRSVLHEGASAFMPRVMEQMHRIASTFR